MKENRKEKRLEGKLKKAQQNVEPGKQVNT